MEGKGSPQGSSQHFWHSPQPQAHTCKHLLPPGLPGRGLEPCTGDAGREQEQSGDASSAGVSGCPCRGSQQELQGVRSFGARRRCCTPEQGTELVTFPEPVTRAELDWHEQLFFPQATRWDGGSPRSPTGRERKKSGQRCHLMVSAPAAAQLWLSATHWGCQEYSHLQETCSTIAKSQTFPSSAIVCNGGALWPPKFYLLLSLTLSCLSLASLKAPILHWAHRPLKTIFILFALFYGANEAAQTCLWSHLQNMGELELYVQLAGSLWGKMERWCCTSPNKSDLWWDCQGLWNELIFVFPCLSFPSVKLGYHHPLISEFKDLIMRSFQSTQMLRAAVKAQEGIL